MTTPVPFTTHRDAEIRIDMSFMCGTIQASLSQLVRAFGSAQHLSGDGNSTTSWRLGFADADETIATIYDWGRTEAPGADECIAWHIGGYSRKAVELVHGAFRASLDAANPVKLATA